MSYASEEAQMVGHLGRRMLEMAFGAQPPIKRKRNESEEESKDETAGYNVSTKPQKKTQKKPAAPDEVSTYEDSLQRESLYYYQNINKNAAEESDDRAQEPKKKVRLLLSARSFCDNYAGLCKKNWENARSYARFFFSNEPANRYDSSLKPFRRLTRLRRERRRKKMTKEDKIQDDLAYESRVRPHDIDRMSEFGLALAQSNYKLVKKYALDMVMWFAHTLLETDPTAIKYRPRLLYKYVPLPTDYHNSIYKKSNEAIDQGNDEKVLKRFQMWQGEALKIVRRAFLGPEAIDGSYLQKPFNELPTHVIGDILYKVFLMTFNER